MAVYDHEEQEQLEALKAWWHEHGNKVLNVVLLLAAIGAGVYGWRWWQNSQAASAGVLYGQLQSAAEKHDTKVVREASLALAEKYSGTSYAGMGALVAAKVQADAGDAKNARAQLAWAAENASDAGLRDLARLRLAGLLLDDKQYDEALKQLAQAPAESFAVRYAELKGDVYVAQGKKEEARSAYQSALNKLDSKSNLESPSSQREAMYRELMQIKLESVGGKV